VTPREGKQQMGRNGVLSPVRVRFALFLFYFSFAFVFFLFQIYNLNPNFTAKFVLKLETQYEHVSGMN
jgi:hypothetical protein